MCRSFKILLIVFIGLLGGFPHYGMAQSKKIKYHNINWSVNLSKRQDSLRLTFFNLGLITNIQNQRGAGINVLSSVVRDRMYGLQLTGIFSYAEIMNGLQIGGFANLVKKDAAGLMVGGLVNATGNNAAGCQLAGLSNISGDYFEGLAVAGLMNTNGKRMNGAQLSLLGNVGADVRGTQLCMITNIVANSVTGLQLAGVANIAVNVENALQLSMLTNVTTDTMKGVQIGLGNYANHIKGTQIGLLNVSTGKVNGWQIGILNHSTDTTTHKIGLINIHPKTKIQAMLFGSNTSKFNVAVRFKNRTNYSILGLGTHYFDLDEDFSGCIFYRTGLYFPLKKRFEISSDLGYFHIENFENKEADTPDRLYSIQARVNLSYRILPKLSIFASTGYAMTRYYKKNKLFDNKGIIEGGIVLF